jgi:hypothetical protein
LAGGQFGRGFAGSGQASFGAIGSRAKKQDKRGQSDGMSHALDTLQLNDLDSGGPAGPNSKPKQEIVNRTHFIVEFIWTPDKPRPKPVSSPGSGPGATVTSVTGTTPGTASSTTLPKAPSTTPLKK